MRRDLKWVRPMFYFKRLLIIVVLLGLCYCMQQMGISLWYGSPEELSPLEQMPMKTNNRNLEAGGPGQTKVGIGNVNQQAAAKPKTPPKDERNDVAGKRQSEQQPKKPKSKQQQQQDAVNPEPNSANASDTNKDKNRKPQPPKPQIFKSVPKPTVPQASKPNDNKPYKVVLATTNSVFLDFTRNWLESIRRLTNLPDNINITIVTEDEATYNALAKYPEVHRVKPSLMLPPNKTLVFDSPAYKAFVNKRPKYILDLLEQNHDVLFSDVDTVWLDSPFQYFTDDVDMFIQEDQPAPKLVLCAGFVYYRSNNRTINFVKQWIRRLEQNKHKRPDQIVLNIMLRENAVRKNFKVEILDRKKFVSGRVYFDDEWRKNHTDVKPVFLHNNWIVGHELKVDRFKKLGYWYI